MTLGDNSDNDLVEYQDGDECTIVVAYHQSNCEVKLIKIFN